MIKFNTPTEAKTISDKNTKTLDLIVFTSKDLFQEKQKKIKIVRFMLNFTCKQQGLVSKNSQRFKLQESTE